MGVMESVRATEEAGRLVITPSPVLLDGQKNVAADLIPGESLYSFLSRHVDPSEPWEVRIGGVVVPVEMWAHVKPKHGQIIEVRGAVNRQAVALVAMVALTYFTFGLGTVAAAGWGSAAAAGAFGGGVGGYLFASAVYMAGSALINKVLAPKPPKMSLDNRDSVYSLGAARNGVRLYEPLGLMLGHRLITPDYASAPYTWYEGDDMYLGMVLNVGINVQDVGDIYNADTVLTSYEGVQVYYSGIPGKPQQNIPLYSNADTIDGGALDKSTAWVQRTTPDDTVRVQVNIEGSIGDKDSKGRDYRNSETIQAQYRPVGTTTWLTLTSRVISNDNDKNFEVQRVTMSRDLPRGQYEVRVRRLYTAGDPDKGNWSAASEFQWTNMVAVQADEADYAGMGRIGIRVKATGQLTGAMDQLRLEAWSKPVPVWTGSAWVTESTSNPGALALQFLRGIKDENGKLIAGVGLTNAEIDIPSLQAFMVHCEAEGYTYDHYLTETRSNGDQLDAILRAGFGALSWETGKLGVVWAADGQPVSGVVNMATIKKGQFQVDYTLHNAADGIEATYFDRTDWSVKTLRVAAPGVTTMLNPAQVQLEGVTSEEHAAQLARWHLAQSLYQYKDITYSTDLEHLAYKRMDVLQLQHDLTQWGYGGRLVSVSGNTVTLDEPVPPSATAHIGIRIPGEAVYRIMRVANFTGDPRDTVTLLDAWPSDAPLPTAENAHDYIWIYDFKATPGYRVRVVGKTLESDAKGASVAVVPESPEFWTYVKTGEYTPPKGGSLLNTLPKASNVRVSEVQVVTGDVIHTELSVLFDIKGQAARSVVFAGISGTEIRPVAETVTNQVRFRIGSAGTYTILVRPYSVDGIAGEAASTTYTTTGADIPPPPFDWFTVSVEPGGLRRYAWGYNQFQPADLAGAEIRFAPGTSAPAWDAMTPLGADGFFTAAFESDMPESGQWVFSIRARNTSGELSSRISTTLELTANVGENITDHEDRITTTEQIAQDILSDFAEVNQRIDQVQQDAQQAANDLNTRADNLRDDIDAVMAQVADITGTPEHDSTETYTEGQLVKKNGKLYRALQNVPAGIAITNTAYWALLGDYASLGEAVAYALEQGTVNATEIEAHADLLALLGAATAGGSAFVMNLDTVRVGPSESLGQRLTSIQSEFDTQSGRIDTEIQARTDADSALSGRIDTVQATANNAATKAELTAEQQARASGDAALTSSIELMQVSLGPEMNLVKKPVFRQPSDSGDWTVFTGSAEVTTSLGSNHPTETRVLRITAQGTSNLTVHEAGNRIPVVPGEKLALAFDAYTNFPNRGSYTLGLWFRRANGTQIGSTDQYGIPTMQGHTDWRTHVGEVTVPAEAVDVQPAFRLLSPQVGDRVWTTRIQVKRQDISAALNSQDLALVKTTVSQQGDTLTAHAQRMDSQQTEIEGKASTSYVQLVEGKAEAAGDSASANQIAIQGLSATVGDQSAQITQAMEVAASASSAVATMANPGFEGGNTGWELAGGAQIIASNSRTGDYALRISSSGNALNTQKIYDIRGGQSFRIGAWLRYTAERPNEWLRVAARCYAANGAYLRDKFLHVLPTEISTSYQRFVTSGTFESDVAFVRVRVATAAGHTSGMWLVDDVFFEPETNTLAELMAKYTLAVQAGGDIAGIQLLAGGGISAFRILASMFQIVDPGGTGGYTHSAGVSVWRIGSAMIAIGPGFGAGNEFVFWAGPNQSNLNNCTRANAGMYFTRTNDAYFGGTLTAGALYHPSQATFTAYPLNVQTEVGPFVSQGGTKRVSSQFRYNNSGTVPGNVTSGHGQTFNGTVTIYRRIGTGAWTQVNSYPITGVKSAIYQSELNRTVVVTTINGAISYNDTSTSTSDFSYRARVTALSDPAVAGVPVEGEITIASKEG